MTYDFLPSVAAPLARLIQEFHKLPGIGPKSAQRLAYYLIRMPEEEAASLAESIISVKERVVFCSICQNITEESPCYICSHMGRDRSRICVVEEPLDVLSLERTQAYRGLYHVLHGAISPATGIGPENLRIRELLERLRERRSHGGHPGDQPKPGGRKHRYVRPQAAVPAGGARHPACPWSTRGGRPGVRRLRHAQPRDGGTAGDLETVQQP